MPSANVPPVSGQVWELMTPGMQEVSKELNALFNRVPAWDKGYPWRTLPGPRREWTAEHTMPCGSQQREELSALVKELDAEGQRVPVRPKAKAKPALEPSPFESLGASREAPMGCYVQSSEECLECQVCRVERGREAEETDCQGLFEAERFPKGASHSDAEGGGDRG